MAKKVITQPFSVPLEGARTAQIEIDVSSGNLIVGTLKDAGTELASGTWQFLEKQDPPTQTLKTENGHANLTLQADIAWQSWPRLPWSACNAATEWKIDLNPKVHTGIHAHSGGGNISLDLAEAKVNSVMAETGGGNVRVELPSASENGQVVAKSSAGNVTVDLRGCGEGSRSIYAESGAGNVVVSVPSDLAARVQAVSGLGKVSVDPRFIKIDEKTFQTEKYAVAENKFDITAKSGAGNVSIN